MAIYSSSNLTATGWTGNCTVSIGEESEISNGIVIYPNPSDGNFRFSIADFRLEGGTLSVFDIHGRQVASIKNLQSKICNLQSLSPGLYFLRMDQNNYTFSGKLVIGY